MCGSGKEAPKKLTATMTIDDQQLLSQEAPLTPLHMLDEDGLPIEVKATDSFLQGQGAAETEDEFVKVRPRSHFRTASRSRNTETESDGLTHSDPRIHLTSRWKMRTPSLDPTVRKRALEAALR